ncbi:aifA [Symbiodinium microadriaticum]|nr:aifA [Symbiodinium microadriaticum]
MKGGHSSLWLFGEQVAFSGDAVSAPPGQERKADGGLQAQVREKELKLEVLLIEKSSGDKLADGPSAAGYDALSGVFLKATCRRPVSVRRPAAYSSDISQGPERPSAQGEEELLTFGAQHFSCHAAILLSAASCCAPQMRRKRGVGSRAVPGWLCLSALVLAWTALPESVPLALPSARPVAKKKVVVIGGGFAGLAAVRRLRRDFEVTLVDAKEFFEFSPGMIRPYTQPQLYGRLVLDYRSLCNKMKVAWIWGAAKKIDEKEVVVQLSNTSTKNAQLLALPYDYCIISAGCHYSSNLWYASLLGKDRERSLEGRRERIDSEHAKLSELAARGAHVAVIGAGYVGVEYAAELRYYYPTLQITLVGGNRGVCPSMCPGARKYIKNHLEKNNITTISGTRYSEANSTLFWKKVGRPPPERVFKSVGMQPHCEFLPSACLSSKGWVKVTPTLQVVSRSGDGDPQDSLFAAGKVFAVGNCADDVPGILPLPKNSYPAEEMAAHAVRNIRRSEKNRPLKPLHWAWPSSVCATSLGPKDGVLLVNQKLPGSGFVAMRGRTVVWLKEIIRWSKVDECRMGLFGTLCSARAASEKQAEILIVDNCRLGAGWMAVARGPSKGQLWPLCCKWDWIAETLDAMGQSEVYDVGSGSCDQEGRCLLDYAAMTVLAEPKAAKEGLTALHYAAFAGSGDAVTALLRAKACCDAKAHGGITPLMLAAPGSPGKSLQELKIRVVLVVQSPIDEAH